MTQRAIFSEAELHGILGSMLVTYVFERCADCADAQGLTHLTIVAWVAVKEQATTTGMYTKKPSLFT